MVRESHPLVFRLINFLKKAEALALKDISYIEHGLEQKKQKCYTRLTSNLNRIVDQFDRANPVKTLKKIADVIKLGQAVDMSPEEEHLLTDHQLLIIKSGLEIRHFEKTQTQGNPKLKQKTQYSSKKHEVSKNFGK